MSDLKKRARSTNMSAGEKVLLVDLCTKYVSLIENKKTDGLSSKAKEEGWKQLATEFQAAGGERREWTQLKHVRIIHNAPCIYIWTAYMRMCVRSIVKRLLWPLCD